VWTYNTAIVLIGAALLGAQCAVVGTFAVLRRRALLGDVLAHAALPGIVLAFWLTGNRSLPILLTGAASTGLIGIAILAYLKKRSRTREDAALGLVLSVFFGIGIALSRYVQNAVPGGGKAGLDTFIFGKTAGIVLADVLGVALVGALSLVLVMGTFKELRMVSFDPQFAATQGYPVVFLDLLMMGLVVVAVVVGLPMVGIVMVAALTILPAVAARFWTSRLPVLLALAATIGMVATSLGALWSAAQPGWPTGPVMILLAGGLFVLSALFAPHRGLITDLRRRSRARAALAEKAAEELLRARQTVTLSDLSRLGFRRPRQTLELLVSRGVALARAGTWVWANPPAPSEDRS